MFLILKEMRMPPVHSKVDIFWEGHKILRNLHQLFVLCTASQMIGEDFMAFSEYMNFNTNIWISNKYNI